MPRRGKRDREGEGPVQDPAADDDSIATNDSRDLDDFYFQLNNKEDLFSDDDDDDDALASEEEESLNKANSFTEEEEKNLILASLENDLDETHYAVDLPRDNFETSGVTFILLTTKCYR